MHTGTRPRPAVSAVVADGRATGRRGRAVGMALMLSSSLGSQTGAAIGALAFPVIGPVGVVAVRQWVAGVILLAVGRPHLRSFTRQQWLPVLGLAAVFATMNVSLYTAIDRVGLGLAVTLEFLGPLSVALVGAWTVTPPGFRRRRGRAHPAAADHRLPRRRAGDARRAVLGGLHPAQPLARAPPARPATR